MQTLDDKGAIRLIELRDEALQRRLDVVIHAKEVSGIVLVLQCD
jgi:hypothetical protein